MKHFLYFCLLVIVLLAINSLTAQVWYRAEMQSVRGYNNDCDFAANEEGEFEVRLSDNINFGAWSYSGCMECDGNMNNGTGVTCTKTNLIRDQSYTTANTARFENRAQEDDGVSNCDWPNDCHDGWGDTHDIPFSSISQNTWQSYTRTRSSRWQMTYRLIWTYAVPISGNASLTATGIVTDGYGEIAGYANNQDGSLTIYPVNSCQRVRITFNTFNTESGFDFVSIYNGNSTSAPLISTTSGSTAPASAVSTAKDGSLTVRFNSDGSVTSSGFRFTITNEDYPTPAGNPATFGSNTWNVYGYCGNNLNLSGLVYRGSYTESSLSYNTTSRWGSSLSPSDASGWSGNALRDDYHTVVSKRQGFPAGYYTLSIPSHDDDIRVYINGIQVFEHIGCCDAHDCFWAGTLNSSSTVEVRHIDGVGGSNQALTFTSTLDPATFGTNQWNVYAYNGSAFNNHFGYYTTNRTNEFNIGADGMGATSNPSAITGGTINGATVGAYAGCALGNDAWSISAKRQGFPCGLYNVNLVGHDDDYLLNIDHNGDGTVDFTTSAGCCNIGLGTKWTGVLTASSRVEIQLREGSGDAYIDMDFVSITPALAGGTIGGITNGVNICTGTDPGAFTSAATASGGASAVYTGGSSTYQWESSTTSASSGFSSISGATATTYNPPTLTQTTWYRRRVTDACGTLAYSNVIQVIVLPYPSGGSIASVNFCPNGSGTVSVSGVSNATQYSWVLPAGFSGSSTTGSINLTTTNAPTTSTNYTINVFPQNVAGGTTCTAAAAISGTITVFGTTITSGTVGGSASLTQCTGGNPVAFSVGSPSGGNGTYTYQWEQSLNCTGTWANATAEDGITNTLNFNPPVLNSVGSMCYRLRITDGCGSIGYSTTKTYTVVADPAAPSATKSPNTAATCAGTTLTLTGASLGAGGTGTCTIQYAFSTDGGLNYSAWNTSVPSFAATGSDNRIKIRTSCTGTGCDLSPETVYTWAINPLPTISLSAVSPFCQAASFSLPYTASTNSPNQYSITAGSPAVAGFAAVTNATLGSSPITVSIPANTAAGTYQFNLTVRNSSTGCVSANQTFNITILERPVASTCKQDDPCQGAAGQITVNVSGGTTPYQITYSPAGTPPSPISTSSGSTVISGLTGGQTYNFTVTGANGCTAQ